MGISTFILFKQGESIPANELLAKINEMCASNGLYFFNDYEKYDDAGRLKFSNVIFQLELIAKELLCGVCMMNLMTIK